jgi:hypothetical protein
MKQNMHAVKVRFLGSLHQGMWNEIKKNAQKENSLRTWVASEGESVNGCSDNEADGYVEVADDYFDTGKNCVVSSKSKRIVCVCRDGKR